MVIEFPKISRAIHGAVELCLFSLFPQFSAYQQGMAKGVKYLSARHHSFLVWNFDTSMKFPPLFPQIKMSFDVFFCYLSFTNTHSNWLYLLGDLASPLGFLPPTHHLSLRLQQRLIIWEWMTLAGCAAGKLYFTG